MSIVPDALDKLPRLRLAKLPTPLDEMPRLTKTLGGPRLLVKRDDLTGLATGGNKTRKLEFLIADALAQGSDSVITAGGPQSNHCRQTAAAAAIAGLECHLVLGGEPQPPVGNLLLDQLLGATIHWTPKPERNARMQAVAVELRAAGRNPYVIPIGGSTPLGAVGYVAAMFELVRANWPSGAKPSITSSLQPARAARRPASCWERSSPGSAARSWRSASTTCPTISRTKNSWPASVKSPSAQRRSWGRRSG